ncbi:MAG: DinB family protein [Dehalococcoidia bacterium]
MEPAAIQALFRFNTFANEALRGPLLAAGDEVVRRPLTLWFGSVFNVLAHLCGGESVWLARLCDKQPQARTLTADDFPSVAALVETWRDLDAQWETFVGSLSAHALEEATIARRSDGNTYAFTFWQPLIHVANHSTEHRGHATVAMTQLGMPHSKQDFLDQFRTPASG